MYKDHSVKHCVKQCESHRTCNEMLLKGKVDIIHNS